MKQVFIADDGREFDNEEAAKTYEATAPMRSKIKAHVDEKYGNKKGLPTRSYNVIVDWEAVRSQVLSAD